MPRTILDVHILQTVPPNNLNRDDTGTPKTAHFGGALRARVSSQAWKRATRHAFGDLLDARELGTRTKRVAEFVAERIQERDATIPENEAWTLAAEVIKTATGSKIEKKPRKPEGANDNEEDPPESAYLMFLSARQRDALAELAIEGRQDIAGFVKEKENKQRARQAADTHHSVDIALFGRMVADGADINVDAAAQVAHAISVHAVDLESDYYTAVDDRRGDAEPGAGMIGTVEFNSATLYRYAALDVDQLHRNLGAGLREDETTTEPVRRAVSAFLRGFVESMPTGKANTFGNHTLPEAVVVKLRTARPVSFASAFEEPVDVGQPGGFLRGACARLASHVPEVERAFGTAENTPTWLVRVGEATGSLADLGTEVSITELVDQVGVAAAERSGSE